MSDDRRETVFVTGGTGFIGSHCAVALLRANYNVVVFDSGINSDCERVVKAIEKTVGPNLSGRLLHHSFMLGTSPTADLDYLFSAYHPIAVLHLAALKAVGESVQQPLKYWQNNVGGLLQLLECMDRANCRNLVFSSSATVYGAPETDAPIPESAPLHPTNPYGQTKVAAERLLSDLAAANADGGTNVDSGQDSWHIVSLRYFNPIGADSKGLLGESPNGIPANLFPYVLDVACGKRDKLLIYGDDWDTRDGTGERDYIHVSDLADAHVAALRAVLMTAARHSFHTAYNVGTGRGYTVRQVADVVQTVSSRDIATQVVPRRAGDVGRVVADCSKIERELGWKASKTLTDMCRDGWWSRQCQAQK